MIVCVPYMLCKYNEIKQFEYSSKFKYILNEVNWQRGQEVPESWIWTPSSSLLTSLQFEYSLALPRCRCHLLLLSSFPNTNRYRRRKHKPRGPLFVIRDFVDKIITLVCGETWLMKRVLRIEKGEIKKWWENEIQDMVGWSERAKLASSLHIKFYVLTSSWYGP